MGGDRGRHRRPMILGEGWGGYVMNPPNRAIRVTGGTGSLREFPGVVRPGLINSVVRL